MVALVHRGDLIIQSGFFVCNGNKFETWISSCYRVADHAPNSSDPLTQVPLYYNTLLLSTIYHCKNTMYLMPNQSNVNLYDDC